VNVLLAERRQTVLQGGGILGYPFVTTGSWRRSRRIRKFSRASRVAAKAIPACLQFRTCQASPAVSVEGDGGSWRQTQQEARDRAAANGTGAVERPVATPPRPVQCQKAVLRFIAAAFCPQPLAAQLRQLRRSMPERLA
jgi:hypothetical protein